MSVDIFSRNVCEQRVSEDEAQGNCFYVIEATQVWKLGDITEKIFNISYFQLSVHMAQ